MTINNLLDQYKSYLGEYISDIKITETGKSDWGVIHEVAFPFWLPNGDGICIYIQIQKEKIVITDGGDTYFNVSVGSLNSSKRPKIRLKIENILEKTNGIKLGEKKEEDIFTEIPLAEASSFPQRLQDFLCTIYSIHLVLC